jgi:hypothetical protein
VGTSIAQPISTSAPFYGPDTTPNIGYQWIGRIAVARFYNRPLSSDEVLRNYNAEKSRFQKEDKILNSTSYTIVDDASMVLHIDASDPRSYPGGGTTVYDLSSRAHHGTLISNPRWFDAQGGGFVFDGNTRYINFPYQLLDNAGDFTIDVWCTGGASGSGTVFANYPAGNLQLFYRQTFAGLYLANGSAYVSGSSFPAGPTHIAVTRVGNYVTQYFINGVLQQSGATVAQLGTVSNYRIGTNTNGTEQYVGTVFNLRAYRRALSSQEIMQNYQAHRERFGV